MSVMELYGLTPRAKYKSYKGDMNGTVKNHLLNKVIDQGSHRTHYERDFSTTRCKGEVGNRCIRIYATPEGKLYLSAIIDLHNREIISYNISEMQISSR